MMCFLCTCKFVCCTCVLVSECVCVCLQAINDELSQVRLPIEEAQQSGAALVDVCGVPGKMEVQKHMEDLAGTCTYAVLSLTGTHACIFYVT